MIRIDVRDLLRVQGSGFRVQGAGFRVQGSVFKGLVVAVGWNWRARPATRPGVRVRV